MRVFPGHNLPAASPGIIPVAAIANPAYISAPTELAGASNDVGFIKSITPRYLSRYPATWWPTQDVPNAVWGTPYSDPWWINTFFTSGHGCINSWRYISTFYGGSCYGGARNATISILPTGYPSWVGSFDNRSALLPFTQYSQLLGNPSNYGFFYSNYSGAGPSVGLRATSSSGDSGGPIFGKISASTIPGTPTTQPLYYLLGVVTASVQGVIPQPYSIGAFPRSFWSEHLSWQPSFVLAFQGGRCSLCKQRLG